MSLKNNTIYTVLFLLPFSLMSQKTSKNIEVKHGPEVKSKYSTVQSVLGYHNNGYVLTRHEKRNMLLEKINDNLTTVNKVVISNSKYEGLKKYTTDVKIIDDKIYVISYVNDKKQGRDRLS
ncbi:MAG: hypothetical protein ACK4K0_09280 [Flavobacteriales bacterium]